MRMPQAYMNAPATKTEAKRITANVLQATQKTQVKARIDMSAEVAGAGMCPECRKPMVLMQASGHQVYTCMEDRITIPVQDEVKDEQHDTAEQERS